MVSRATSTAIVDLFGTPADDPQFARLEALAMEHMHRFAEAHAAWQRFEQSLANNPAFPGELGQRARALVLHHMGWNAVHEEDMEPEEPSFLDDDEPDQPQPLHPTAEECFKRSLELTPDQLRDARGPVPLLPRPRKGRRRGKGGTHGLLQHFPDHVPTLSAAG